MPHTVVGVTVLEIWYTLEIKILLGVSEQIYTKIISKSVACDFKKCTLNTNFYASTSKCMKKTRIQDFVQPLPECKENFSKPYGKDIDIVWVGGDWLEFFPLWCGT